MSASILIATPQIAFGELLRLSLEENGHHQIRLVKSTEEAKAALERYHFQLAIIDSDLKGEPFTPFAIKLMEQYNGLRVVLIPPENDPNHASLGGLIPHGYLSRPFYLPDLIELINRLLADSNNKTVQTKYNETSQSWLNDSILLQGFLEKQVESSDCVAALVIANGTLCANSGSLPLQAAQEMASLLMRYWNRDDKTDLIRYIRLSSIKGDYLVYVTEVVDGVVLIVAYEPGIPISKVRPETRTIALRMASASLSQNQDITERLANSSSSPSISKNGASITSLSEQEITSKGIPGNEPIINAENQSEGYQTATDPSNDQPHITNQKPLFEDDHPNHGYLDISRHMPESDEIDSEELNTFDLSVLLGTVPSPEPNQDDINPKNRTDTPTLEWVHETNLWERDLLHDRSDPQQSRPIESDKPGLSINITNYNSVEKSTEPWLFGPESQIDPLSDTRPHVLNTITHLSQLEPATPTLSLLNYTCVLIPRLPQHYLTGELADNLSQWVQHFCLAFGWRLEGISIRPDYLQWTVQVAPSVSPGNLVRIIRQRTSTAIFKSFGYLENQNPSGDFWATGYLIVSGSQPPSASLLRDFINQTRKRQGIAKF